MASKILLRNNIHFYATHFKYSSNKQRLFSGEYTTIHQNDSQFLATDLSLIFVCIWIKYLITTQRDTHIQTRDICSCSFTSKCHILKGLC